MNYPQRVTNTRARFHRFSICTRVHKYRSCEAAREKPHWERSGTSTKLPTRAWKLSAGGLWRIGRDVARKPSSSPRNGTNALSKLASLGFKLKRRGSWQFIIEPFHLDELSLYQSTGNLFPKHRRFEAKSRSIGNNHSKWCLTKRNFGNRDSLTVVLYCLNLKRLHASRVCQKKMQDES